MAKRPIPTAIKKLQGTLQPCRTNPNEPKPDLAIPLPPDWMPDEVKEVFNDFACQFAAMQVLSHSDGKALELLADAYYEYKKAREFVYQHGQTYECETAHGKIIRTYPQVAIAADAYKRMRSMLIEFGATPAARSKVSVVPQPKPSRLAELMRKKEEDDFERYFNGQ